MLNHELLDVTRVGVEEDLVLVGVLEGKVSAKLGVILVQVHYVVIELLRVL